MNISKYWRYPVRVLGCLQNGKITVIICAGVGMADGGVEVELPIQIVPIDLRMPNCEFDILFDRALGCFVKVLRKHETDFI